MPILHLLLHVEIDITILYSIAILALGFANAVVNGALLGRGAQTTLPMLCAITYILMSLRIYFAIPYDSWDINVALLVMWVFAITGSSGHFSALRRRALQHVVA